MAGYQAKTVPTTIAPADVIAALPEARRREEAQVLDALYRQVTGLEPKMWGPSLIGYGSYRYRYASGHAGEAMRGGFSPRKAAHSLYVLGDFGEREGEGLALLARLGKHKAAKGCLYVNKLADIDLGVLEELVRLSWETMNARYPG